MRIQVLLNGASLFDSKDPSISPGAVSAVAAYFAGLTDDEQAQFFESVGQAMATWHPGHMEQQAWHTGRHIRTCRCIGQAGKDYLRAVYEASVHEAPTA